MLIKYLILGIILSCIISFYSCSENPVNPNNEISFDSARYNWTSYYLDPYIIDVQAYDDNNVFLLNPGSIYKFDGTNISLFYDAGFSIPFFKVISPNEIYVLSSYEYASKIYKYQNGQLNIFINTIDTGLLANSFEYINGDFWIGGGRGDIYKVSNGIISKYQIDSLYRVEKIRVINNEVYICAMKSTSFKTFIVRYYKLNNSVFNLLYEAEYSHLIEENNVYVPTLDHVENVFFTSIWHKGVFQLSGNSFNQIINMDGFRVNAYIGGTHNNYLLNAYYQKDSLPTNSVVIFNWNGQKFSKEIYNWEYPGSVQKITYKENKFYIIASVGLANTQFCVGTINN